MADDGNTEETAQDGKKSDEAQKGKEKKGEKKKKTWEEKQQQELKKKKEKFMPFGSDPCFKMRQKGGVPRGQLTDIKGSAYPWFVKPRKVMDIQKDLEAKYEKEKKKTMKKGEKLFKQSNKRLREYLKEKSCEIHKRRIFDANKDPDCDETYEEYLARKERKKRMKERRKKEEEEEKKAVEEERKQAEEKEKAEKDKEKKQKEIDDNGPPKKKRKTDKEKPTMMESWPGMYVTSATQDYITLLKYIIEAEFETGTSTGKEASKRPNTKKNKAVKQFKSFLNVLFTANEMMKDNASSKKNTTKDKSDKKKDQDDNKPEDSKETPSESKAEDVADVAESAPEEAAQEDAA